MVVADGVRPPTDPRLVLLLQEAFRHAKPLAAWGDGTQLLRTAGIELDAPGLVVAERLDDRLTSDLVAAVGMHRVWERAPA